MNALNNSLGESSQQPNEIIISPLKKGRRILVFLADFFINFIMAIIFMNAAVTPITKAIGNYEGYSTSLYDYEVQIADILCENKVLYYETEDEKIYLTSSVYYTADLYLKYYVTGEGSEYEIFSNYFNDIREDNESYLAIYEDESNIFFDISETGEITLKSYYYDQFIAFYRTGDEPSSSAEDDYDAFTDDFFYPAFNKILDDIAVNDLTYGDLSYNEIDSLIEYAVDQIDNLVTIAVYISFILSTIICYFVIPLITKNGQTIGMKVLKVERIGINNLYLLKKPEVVLCGLYSTITNLCFIMFLGYPTVTFDYLFALGSGQFLTLSLISLVIILMSLLFLLFTSFNQTLFDKLSRSVMINTDSLDEIYRMKGYKV